METVSIYYKQGEVFNVCRSSYARISYTNNCIIRVFASLNKRLLYSFSNLLIDVYHYPAQRNELCQIDSALGGVFVTIMYAVTISTIRELVLEVLVHFT